jgi:hypothetical protein
MRKVHQKNLVDRGTQTEIYISDDEWRHICLNLVLLTL